MGAQGERRLMHVIGVKNGVCTLAYPSALLLAFNRFPESFEDNNTSPLPFNW